MCTWDAFQARTGKEVEVSWRAPLRKRAQRLRGTAHFVESMLPQVKLIRWLAGPQSSLKKATKQRSAHLQHGLSGAKSRLELGPLLDDAGVLQLPHLKHSCAEESLPPHFDRLARRIVANRIPERMLELSTALVSLPFWTRKPAQLTIGGVAKGLVLEVQN